jgi:hypothetical protein
MEIIPFGKIENVSYEWTSFLQLITFSKQINVELIVYG